MQRIGMEINSNSLNVSARAPIWNNAPVTIFPLAQNMRAAEDSDWQDYLLRLGDGLLPVVPAIGPYSIRIPTDVCALRGTGVNDLID